MKTDLLDTKTTRLLILNTRQQGYELGDKMKASSLTSKMETVLCVITALGFSDSPTTNELALLN